MATRMAVILPSLIHSAQANFVKGRSATSNICKVFLALEYSKSHPLEGLVIIMLDVEKAIDNVSFKWLFMVLQRLICGSLCRSFARYVL